MASDSQMMNLVLRDCNWVLEGLESIVDVGGGTGITTFPNLKCIVLECPHVVENLSGCNNLAYVGEDMFKSIPKVDAVQLRVKSYNTTYEVTWSNEVFSLDACVAGGYLIWYTSPQTDWLPPNAPEKVGESIAAPVVAAAVEVGMSQRATSRPKKCPPPSITLLEYTWVDREARRNQIVAVSGPLSNLAANPTTGPHEVSANVVPPVDKDPKGKRKHKKQSHREHQRA
ncbi:hypothetical protein JHK85_022827 [Glycine max]|nr:hypothetical protein JHK85_022827 [Glycine max]